ncbi:carbohydrate ABC transporter permease [Marinilactibacillus psychrotolerans]|uniref:carbohydrate ABC transporter permease n=1 Tax=Marinilactibacillus psychrotolerans TaxID=191770 RepID=UPI00388996D5
MFIAPQILLLTVFVLYPVFLGFRMSLFQHSYATETFVGLENYITLFNDPVFIRSIINTFIFIIGIVGLTIAFSLFVSTTVFDKNPKYLTFIRGSYYLPVMVSMVVMSIIWNFFLNPANGLISYLLSEVGIENINMLGNKNTVLGVIIFVTFVGNVGQAIVLYIASMIGIPADYFEAADIDGASRWHKIKHILIPLVRPTTIYLVITNVVMVLKIFVVIQLLTGGGPNNASVTLMYFLYQNAFEYNNIGVAAAVGVIMFLVALVLAVPQLRGYMGDNKK